MSNDELALAALSSFNNTLANNANVILASQTSRQDRNFSREMSDLAWQRNIEAWNMQNEYNLPANQYKRQLEGLQYNGLNPNLVYGNSSSVSGAAGGISPYRFDGYHSTAVPHFGGANPINDLLSTRLLQTQVAAQEAQNRLINARADNESARNPGIVAKSQEAAYRWNYITENIHDEYEAQIRAQVATEYWKGVKVEYDASSAHYLSDIRYYEMCMAEWLNTTNVPGTDFTYRQYLEHYKTLMTEEQYKYLKELTLDVTSRIAFREKQGQLVDLKAEYQKELNKYAKLGSFGNSFLGVLFSGLMNLFGDDDEGISNIQSAMFGVPGVLYKWYKDSQGK